MKKLIKSVLFILIVIGIALFVSTLTGCESDKEEQTLKYVYYNPEFENKIMYGCSDIYGDVTICKDYIMVYTQDQVDQLINNAINDYEDDLEDDWEYIQFLINEQYTNDELDEGFEDVLIYIQVLEQRIIELEAQNNE